VLATVLAGVARYVAGVPRLVAFVLAGVALAGDAWVVSLTIGQVGRRLGPSITGVLHSTLGNLPEFFVVLFALNAGELVVAKTAIVGSILVNALLVLGLVIVAGARHEPGRTMHFSARLPNDTATLMLVACFIIALVALADSSHDAASHHIEGISIVSAVAILAVYAVWISQYLRASDGRAKAWPCWRARPWPRRSCRAGSSTRSSRRSARWASRSRSPGS
jgi:Ca2+:H+ antiporter